MGALEVLYLPIAISGSGKTTLRKELLKDDPAICVVSPDDIRKRFLHSETTGIYHLEEIEPIIWEEAYDNLKAVMRSGLPVYFDATNLVREFRKDLFDMAREFEYSVVVYDFNCSLSLALKRNKQRKRHVEEEVIHRQYETKESILKSELHGLEWKLKGIKCRD